MSDDKPRFTKEFFEDIARRRQKIAEADPENMTRTMLLDHLDEVEELLAITLDYKEATVELVKDKAPQALPHLLSQLEKVPIDLDDEISRLRQFKERLERHLKHSKTTN